MHISKQTKQEIENLFLKNDFNCRSVSISEKEINGKKTSEICIKIGVPRKKAKSELRPEEIVPEELEIDGKKYKTDVVEMPEIKSMACFGSSDPNILKLQGNPQLLTPLKGGQEITQFPTGWQDAGGGNYNFSVGTLGFFCVDDLDGKLVGITNSHVVIPEQKLLFSGDKDPTVESTDPFNTIDEKEWIVDNQNYTSSVRCRDESGGSTIQDIMVDTAFNIKRYHPFKTSGPNYVDAALIIMNPTYVSENESFKIHHPDNVTESTDKLIFATEAEIDSLLDSPKPKLFSTGRTTGPKGWGTDNACLMEATDVSINANINFGGSSIPFNDLIRYTHVDNSTGVIGGGDSGSVVLAEIAGIKKVVGLAFAGPQSGDSAFACRIDRIVQALKIRQWDSSYTFDTTVPKAKMIIEPIENVSADQLSIIQNNKEYFQTGTTIKSVILGGISPNTGDEAGGTVVTLTGTGFSTFNTSTDSWEIGGSNVTGITVISDTEMTGTTPAGVGDVDVTVTLNGDIASLTRGFSYTSLNSGTWTPEEIIDPVIHFTSHDQTTYDVDANGIVEVRDRNGGSIMATPVGLSGWAPQIDEQTPEFLFAGDNLVLNNPDFDEISCAMIVRGSNNNTREFIMSNMDQFGNSRSLIVRFDSGKLQIIGGYPGGGVNIEYLNVNAQKSLISWTMLQNGQTTRLNGGDERFVAASGPLDNSNIPINIGAQDESFWNLNGAIPELIFKFGPISSNDMRKLEGFLAHRNGMADDLDNNHPFKNSPP